MALRRTLEGELLGFNLAHLPDSVVVAKCQAFHLAADGICTGALGCDRMR